MYSNYFSVSYDSLRGMLSGISSDIDKDSLREERLLKYENNV